MAFIGGGNHCVNLPLPFTAVNPALLSLNAINKMKSHYGPASKTMVLYIPVHGA